MKRISWIPVLPFSVLAAMLLAACVFTRSPISIATTTASANGAPQDAMVISSPDFGNKEDIPSQFTCDSANEISPAFEWKNIPQGTQSLALIVEDQMTGRTFIHWVLYNISPSLSSLPEGIKKLSQVSGIGTQGKNDFGDLGYGGPCPPKNDPPHQYHFKLFALDLTPELPEWLSADQLAGKMTGHLLAQAEWIGQYSLQK